MENEIFCKIEFRQDESRQSPGRLSGILVPYGKRANDRPEMFEPNSLYWPDEGIVIREMHNRLNPIVKVLPFVEGSELRIDAVLPDTQRARDVATSMKGDLPLYSGLSVEFHPERETRRGGLRIIQKALLTGGGLVDIPAYREATAEVRQQEKRRRFWL